MNARTMLLVAALLTAGCDDPASAQVSNQTEAPVYRLWWQTTLFTAPVLPGGTSEVERTVAGSDFAYALLAPGWDAGSTEGPQRLLPIRTSGQLSAARGALLTVTVNQADWVGFCDGGTPLTDEEATLITQSIFAAQFAGQQFDPTTCHTSPSDGGP